MQPLKEKPKLLVLDFPVVPFVFLDVVRLTLWIRSRFLYFQMPAECLRLRIVGLLLLSGVVLLFESMNETQSLRPFQ